MKYDLIQNQGKSLKPQKFKQDPQYKPVWFENSVDFTSIRL